MARTDLTQVESSEDFEIGVHVGNILWQVIHTHKRTSEVMVELAQNALDENAKHLHIIIDAKNGTLWAYDDGQGTTKEEMKELWRKVGTSSKIGKANKTGEKGIAKLAGLSISETYEFTTRPLNIKGSQYFWLVLHREDIKEHEIPKLKCHTLKPGFGYGEAVNFKPTTLVKLSNISSGALRDLSDIENIAGAISSSFSEKIRKQGADIQLIYYPNGIKNGGEKRITVRPMEFLGTKSKKITLPTRFGDVDFQMYVTCDPVPNPQLIVIHQGGRWQFELKNVLGAFESNRIKDVLGSGHFQGYIYLDFGNTLPDRQGLENDHFREAFIQAVLTFNEEHAKPYLAFITSSERTEREEQVLQNSQEKLDLYLREHSQDILRGQLKDFVGPGFSLASTPPPCAPKKAKKKKRPAPPMERVKILILEEKDRKKREAETKTTTPSSKGQLQNRPGANPTKSDPLASSGSRHGIRLVRKLASQTPRFESRTLAKDGVIYFNVEHTDWIEHSKKGEKALQFYVDENAYKEIAGLMADHPSTRKSFLDIFDDHYFRICCSMRR